VEAAAGEDLQLAGGGSGHLEQHLSIGATPDHAGQLVDEVLGPMSHLGSI
jgi:hypothetical protein